MGVLSCDRPGCESIMCDYYSYKYGYICNSCKEEFLRSSMTVEDFMKTYKHEYNHAEEIQLERFKETFEVVYIGDE